MISFKRLSSKQLLASLLCLVIFTGSGALLEVVAQTSDPTTTPEAVSSETSPDQASAPIVINFRTDPVETNPPVAGPDQAEPDNSTVSIEALEPIVMDLPTATSTPTESASCGNGQVETGETCDDHNLSSGDGCNSICQIEVVAGTELSASIMRSVPKLNIIAQWQMLADYQPDLAKLDDGGANQAQILPSGQYQVAQPIMVCAVIGQPKKPDSTSSVKATVNYPVGIAVKTDSANSPALCNAVKAELDLKLLDQAQATRLLCEKIRTTNNNLLTWHTNPLSNLPFGYEELCGQTSLMLAETAGVYCAELKLAYDDPAGDYRVTISARDESGTETKADSGLQYLELINFENDFSSIQYGLINLDTPKYLLGDLDFKLGTAPTVRNTGNTRLQLKIWQNDFTLGKTDGLWNISYRARIGTGAVYSSYNPEQTTALSDALDLGRTQNIDFGALVNHYPENSNQEAFWGKLVLTADKAPFIICN